MCTGINEDFIGGECPAVGGTVGGGGYDHSVPLAIGSCGSGMDKVFCATTDVEATEAFAKKPISHTTLAHYPTHLCNKCMLYCPLGGWKEKFGDTGLSGFKA